MKRRGGWAPWWAAQELFMLGCCAADRDDFLRAAQLVGASERIGTERPGWSESRTHKSLLAAQLENDTRARLVTALGEEAVQRAVVAGRQLTFEQAADLALGRTRPAP